MKKEAFYSSVEPVYSKLLMSWKMATPIVSITLFSHLALWFLIFFLWLDVFEFHILFTYINAFFSAAEHIVYFTVNDMQVSMYASQVNEFLTGVIVPHSELGNKFRQSMDFSLAVYLLVPFIFIYFIDHNTKKWLRGARLIRAGKLQKELKEEATDLPFGSIKLPQKLECRHVFFVGAPGSGKAVFLNQVIERTIQRKDNCVIYDFNGEMVSRFFRPGKDILFNPLDRRCVGWNIFNEIKSEKDVAAVAASFIPTASDGDGTARVLFRAILNSLSVQGKTTNAHVWGAVTMDTYTLLKSLDEARSKGEKESFVSIYNEAREQSIAVHSDLIEHTNSFQCLKDLDGDFSIKKWIEKPEGNIFIPNYVNEKNTLKPVLSLFIDLLSHHLLTSWNTDRRIFFFADALGSLQRISTILNLLALGRRKGASVWLGTQDIGELEKIYGRESRQIIKSCGTRVFFRVPDPANAQYLSDEIGACVRSVPKKSFSMSNPDFWDGVDLSKVEKTEPLILPSEIQSLPDLNAFVKFVGHDWVRTKVKYKKFRKKNITFEKNPGYAIQQLKTGDQGFLATKSKAKQTKNTDAVKPDPNILEPVKGDPKPGPPEPETAPEKQKSEVEIDQAKPEIKKKQAAQEQTSGAIEKGPNLKLSEIIF